MWCVSAVQRPIRETNPAASNRAVKPIACRPRSVGRRTLTCVSAVLLFTALSACASTPWQGTELDPTEVTFAAELDVSLADMRELEPGLYVRDLIPGSERIAARTSRISIHYITWLPDGSVIDSSVGGEPFEFELDSDQVIQGWRRAIAGMGVGGNRQIVVRPGLAYGTRGTPKVPPDSTLVFQVELLEVR